MYRGDQFLRKVELGEAPMRIGRAPENELVLEDRNKGVSRTHAEIRYERGQYLVVDLNSQNGVWIGDRRVKTDPLPADVPVTIGPYRLLLVPDPQPAHGADTAEGTQISPEGEERFAEPTELVQPVGQAARSQAGTIATPPPVRPNRRLKPILAGVGALAVVGVGLVVATIVRKPPVQPPAPIAEQSPPPAPGPTGPTVEEQFLDHYGKAQDHISKGDKAAAATENAEALVLLPSDPRGIKQRQDIEAMGNAVATAEVPATKPVPAVPPAVDPAAETVPSTLKLAPKAGETASQRASREKTARYLLDDGKKAVEDRRYAEAIDFLQRALDTSERQDFGYTADEASTLLQKARAARAAADASQRRASAQKLVEQAKALAGSDIVAAVQRLREASKIDSQAAGVTELMTDLQEKARTQGESAVTSAKNLDNKKRTAEAIREYDKAVQLFELIPGGHKDLDFARQRSSELKTRR